MKEAIGKTKIKVNNFPRKIKIDNQEIYEPAAGADTGFFLTTAKKIYIYGRNNHLRP